MARRWTRCAPSRPTTGSSPGSFRNQAEVKRGFASAEPVGDEFTPEQLLANLVAGSPETCVEKLKRYEALGVDHYVMYASFGADHAATMKSLRLFAERVMPHFAAPSSGRRAT